MIADDLRAEGQRQQLSHAVRRPALATPTTTLQATRRENRLSIELFKKVAGMHRARLPAGRVGGYLLEDFIADRTLAARGQTEDVDIRRQCPHMECAQRRLRNAGVAKMIKLIVDRQPDAGAVRRFLEDQEIAV